MAATAPAMLRVPSSSVPPERPLFVPRDVEAGEFLPPAPHAHTQTPGLVVEREPTQAYSHPSPISISNDVDGQFVVEDVLSAAYGVGPTPQAAVADFYHALDERLSFLRRNEPQLHPGLRRELQGLQRLFPGR
jgi:hypothetical protein